jgi:hypothetical protein
MHCLTIKPGFQSCCSLQKAYDDMKLLLKKSMDECVRLSDEVMRLETQVRNMVHCTCSLCNAHHGCSKTCHLVCICSAALLCLQVRTTQASQAETSAALKAAKREAVEASAQVAAARKDAAAAQRSLEKAQARITELEAQKAEVGD